MSELVVYEERQEDEDHESLGRPFRVKARLYNNRLIKAREEMGYVTQVSAALAIGIAQTLLGSYESMSNSPWHEKTATWKVTAQRIADFYGYHPEELWPEVIQKVKQRYMELEIGSRGFALDASHEIDRAELVVTARNALKTLSPREEKVVRDRFGFNGDDKERAEIGQDFEISGSRIAQIEAKALRKLRHDSRAKKLEVFLPEDQLSVRERRRAREAKEAEARELARREQKVFSEREREALYQARQEREKVQRITNAQYAERQQDPPVKNQIVVWCDHLDREALQTSHWSRMPPTAWYREEGGAEVTAHWYAECGKCWTARVAGGSFSDSANGGMKVRKKDFPEWARKKP